MMLDSSTLIVFLAAFTGLLYASLLVWLIRLRRNDPDRFISIARGLLPGALFRTIRGSTLSVEERAKLNTEEQLEVLSLRIAAEKNAETQKALSEQENKLRTEFEEKLRSDLRDEKGKIVEDWHEILVVSRQRLISESSRLAARSSSNLTYGILFSVVAVVILILVLFLFPPENIENDWISFFSKFGSRFALAAMVQVLGLFFLRMYVGVERDIARNKNEITNLELRLAAGLMAANSKVVAGKLALAMGAEERNFLLAKGEHSSPSFDKEALSELRRLASLLKPSSGGDSK